MPGKFPEMWSAFRFEFEVRNRRLAGDLDESWKRMNAVLGSLQDAFSAVQLPSCEPGSLASFYQALKSSEERLLSQPIALYQSLRPHERVLSALEDHEAAVDDLARQLPETVSVSGLDLVESMGCEDGFDWRAYILRRQRDPRTLPLRAVVQDHLRKQALDRSRAEGIFLLLLTQTGTELLTPWHVVRQSLLQSAMEMGVEEKLLETRRLRWLYNVGDFRRKAARYLEALRKSLTEAAPRLGSAVLRHPSPLSEFRRSRLLDRRQAYAGYWSRQPRAVAALMNVDLALLEMGRHAVREAGNALKYLDSERGELLAELERAIQWAETASSATDPRTFPPPHARLVPAEERVAEWARSVASRSDCIPVSAETLAPRYPLPNLGLRWRTVKPREIFLRALGAAGQWAASEGFRAAEAAHRSIVREIERAREVVIFGLETARDSGEHAERIASESTQNAASLLIHRRDTAKPLRPGAERSLVRACAAALLQSHLQLDEGRLGLMAHLARQGGTRAARGAWETARAGTARSARWQRNALRARYKWFLNAIGWDQPAKPRIDDVYRRSYLSQALQLDLGARDLPMIYQRLFRLAPVEDPRFLVGREAEMAALEEAREMWQAGRSMAVLVVGERGSGKTSLLNCATARVFGQDPVYRGQFNGRVTTPGQMEADLRSLLRIRGDEDLTHALLREPRVIVIEEVERAFLRCMNGFEGLKSLLATIPETSRGTLWVLSLNQTAFDFLKAAVNLDQYFPYRINAMSVELEQLKTAILIRHNFSGLRLQFSAPPARRGMARRAREALGLQESPQDLFFDSLYRESEGIFRSAFQLWLHYTEGVEGGLLHMRYPEAANYDALRSQCSLPDFLTLQAILQHGSLTDEEHAIVFGIPARESRTQLERLKACEVLEPEPAGPGVRVRPEAGHFVRRALSRQNLR
ncbi:MAG: AAA family ATPase [Bryobacteraceae bacterium]